MSITSPTVFWVVTALAVLLPLVLIVVWGRGPSGLGGRLLRLVAVLVCQVLAVGAVGLYANGQYGFYNSWGEVIGETDAGGGAIDLTGLVPADGSQGTVKTITVKVPGAKGPEGPGA